jgi:hypothetical protein
MSKVGQSIRLKQSETKPYVTLGIATTDEGYELRRVTVSGLEVQAFKVLLKSKERAEVMQQLQLELSAYIINFNRGETKETK